MFENNNIIITTSTDKKNILKENNKLNYLKIYTLPQFIKLFYCDYNEKTLYYIMNKYNVNYEISKIYASNLTYINDVTYSSNKLNFLNDLKKDLISNNLLDINSLFVNSLKDKKIVIYNLPESKELTLLINELNKYNDVKILNPSINDYKHTIYHVKSIEDEIVLIANKICNLIKSGISISNIFITNIDDDYKKEIKRIFPMYNLNITLNESRSIIGTHIVNEFLNNYNSNLEITMDYIKGLIVTEEDEDIYNKLINIINDYTFVDNKEDIKDIIINRIKNTNITINDSKNSIHEVSLKDYIFQDTDHVFLPSFNQTIIPICHKNEDYLSDKEKEELNISLTVDLNNIEKESIKNKLSNIKNLYITYKSKHKGLEYFVSSINEELNYEIEDVKDMDLTNSNLYNKIKLASLKDAYRKFNIKSELLSILNTHYDKLPYRVYNNTFTGINPNSLKEFLNNSLKISYTRLDGYYSCPFSFYLSSIIKVQKPEDTFDIKIGNIFHKVLELKNNHKGSYDMLWDIALKEEKLDKEDSFNDMEKFFLVDLKKDLEFILETIEEQNTYTNLLEETPEQEVVLDVPGNISISLKGKIDKIKYSSEDKTLAVIDYKTGNPHIDLTTLPYGLGMQLPIYLYLIKNYDEFKDYDIAGFYLQTLLKPETKASINKDPIEQRKDDLKLRGFSNSDQNIIAKFDKTYDASKLIASLRTNQDGSFSANSKVLSNAQMNQIVNIIEAKVKEGASSIENAKFEIAPKKIGNKNYGCEYCKFKDICFVTDKDINELEPKTIEEVIGGE